MLKDTRKIISVLRNATVKSVNDLCLIQKNLCDETKWWNRKTQLALKLILTVLFAIQTITFAQSGACDSKAARILHFVFTVPVSYFETCCSQPVALFSATLSTCRTNNTIRAICEFRTVLRHLLSQGWPTWAAFLDGTQLRGNQRII